MEIPGPGNVPVHPDIFKSHTQAHFPDLLQEYTVIAIVAHYPRSVIEGLDHPGQKGSRVLHPAFDGQYAGLLENGIIVHRRGRDQQLVKVADQGKTMILHFQLEASAHAKVCWNGHCIGIPAVTDRGARIADGSSQGTEPVH